MDFLLFHKTSFPLNGNCVYLSPTGIPALKTNINAYMTCTERFLWSEVFFLAIRKAAYCNKTWIPPDASIQVSAELSLPKIQRALL